jgi:alpha-amylase/alpha-mannosidase (GH57 family)
MPDSKIRLVVLWHMHQPYYKDLLKGVYRLPWTRLHALKDYYGMVAILREFPHVHATFNLVPSLLAQMEDYAQGTAREPMQEIAAKRAEDLTREERLYMLGYFFQANVEHLISRYPRYRQLFDRMHANEFQPERALPFFQVNDLRDLQVLSQLAWMEEEFLARDAELRALVAKQSSYSFEDQELLGRKQLAILRAVFDAYRAAAERGQIEISTSPFYHPILPLLCDTQVATEAHAWVRLPQRRFRHPEDATLQLERALEQHRRLFGRTPRGLWPSEGSLSEEVLRIAAATGFRWAATDERVLGNSIGVSFHRDASGTLANADRLYRPYSYETPTGPIRLLFRDLDLSDQIGFVYSRMEPRAAAADFLRRIKQSALPLLRQGRSPTVSVILDGENAWEYFPRNGRAFLRALYGMLSEDPDLECVTVSEALERGGPAEPLSRFAPGSWINANFDIWIGAEEDNLAWDYLSEARDFFTVHSANASPSERALALEELLVAEGSDWNWWYGPEHSSVNDADFDELYRTHLANVYHALGHRPPEALAHPIARLRPQAISHPPEAALAPRIDGIVTNYFEWMGAGLYRPAQRDAAMHGGRQPVLSQLFFGRGGGRGEGRDGEQFFLRADFHDRTAVTPERLELRIGVRCDAGSAVAIVSFNRSEAAERIQCGIRLEEITPASASTVPPPRSGSPLTTHHSPSLAEAALGQAALDKVLELRLSLSALGLAAEQPLEFQLTLWENNLPVETLPLEGWLAVPVQG